MPSSASDPVRSRIAEIDAFREAVRSAERGVQSSSATLELATRLKALKSDLSRLETLLARARIDETRKQHKERE
jgi:hypothetical protein